MKKLGENIILKSMMIVSIIISMLFSSFLPILSWATENENQGGNNNQIDTLSETSETDDEYVKFNLTWNSDVTSTDPNDRIAESKIENNRIAYFNLTFNNIQTGFENFRLVVTQTSGTTVDFEGVNTLGNGDILDSAYGNVLYLKSNVPAGTVKQGQIKFKFSKKENEDYVRNLKVTLKGKYELNGETVNVAIERLLTVNLNEKFEVNSYSINIPKEKEEDRYGTYYYNWDYDISHNKESNTVTKRYTVKLKDGGPYVQSSKITLTALKTGSSEINNNPTDITLKYGDECGYTVITPYNAETGSIVIGRGDSTQDRNHATFFPLDTEISLDVTYSLNGEDGNISGAKGVGYYFNLNIYAQAEVYGYDYEATAGHEEYTPRTIFKQASCDTSEFVKNSTDEGIEPTRYGGEIQKIANGMTLNDLTQLKEQGYLSTEFKSSMIFKHVNNDTIGKLHLYNYNFTSSDNSVIHKTVNSEKSYVKYIDENRNNKSKEVTPILTSIEVDLSYFANREEFGKVLFYKKGDVEGVNEPFFTADKDNLSSTDLTSQNITEYYAVYDASEVGNFSWSNASQIDWKSTWRYDKASLGLTDKEIEKITAIGKYQETVENRGKTGSTNVFFYTHNQAWSGKQFAEGVTANTRMYFNLIETSGITNVTDYARVKKITLCGSYMDADIKIYAKGATEGTDEPMAVLNSRQNNIEFTPEDDFVEFYAVEDIKENLQGINGKQFALFVEFEPKVENLNTLGNWPSLVEKVTIENDARTYNVNEATNEVTSVISGSNDYNFNILNKDEYNKNHSTTYQAEYAFKQKNNYIDLATKASAVNTNSIDTLTESEIRIGIVKQYTDESYVRSMKNPVVYLELTNDFEYDYDSFKVEDVRELSVDKTEFKYIEETGKLYYVVYFTGEYNQDDYGAQRGAYDFFKIKFDKMLKPNVISKSDFQLYMSDDYEYYRTSVIDTYDLNGNGSNTDSIFKRNVPYEITSNDGLSLRNNIINEDGEVFKDTAYINPGKIAKMQLITEHHYSRGIESLEIIARIPFAGNKKIRNTSEAITSAGTEFTPEFLGNVKVYVDYILLTDTRDVQIGYSSNATADYSTDDSEFTYIPYKTSYTEEEQNIIKNAKTIKVKRNGLHYLDNFFRIEYDVKVPENAEINNIVGQSFSIKYKPGGSTETQTVESKAVYAIVGERDSTVNIQKEFKGTDESVSTANVEFEIVGLNNSNRYTAITNDSGIATFNNVKKGLYKVVENTEFENYCLEEEKIFEVKASGETKNITVKNVPKTRYVLLHKKWKVNGEDIGKQIQSVRLSISGTTVGNYSASNYKYTDVNGDAKIKIPYGTYNVTETTGVTGWKMTGVYKTGENNKLDSITVDNNNLDTIPEYDCVNEIGLGSITVNKTVPESDSVQGIKFRVYGTAYAQYTDVNNVLVSFDIDKTVDVVENGAPNIGIAVFEDIPYGMYTIEEINIPEITTEDGQITKYNAYKELGVIVDKNNEHIVRDAKNEWKTGRLEVTVTATEGADLTDFSVKVSGTSAYGTDVNIIKNVPESGIVMFDNLLIGKYTVEECNTRKVDGKILTTEPDGYEVTYNPEDMDTAGVKIGNKETKRVSIHNEYIGVGYVKINKTLEGETDRSKANGIQFRIKGKDLTGKDVDEIITIGKNSETNENIEDGVGLSRSIPVGTYSLTEIEETVPEMYEVMEEKEITIKSNNTIEIPLEFNEQNNLAVGKIIMETETEENGYLEEAVTYTVVEVNKNLEVIGTPIEVTGNSRYELNNVKAGRYLVSQKTIPDGYIKDVPKVTKVTRNDYGYALFIIGQDETEEFVDTKVVINKQIVNSEGNTATTEDFENAKLPAEGAHSFEVRIVNIDTKQEYYSFIDEKNSDTIVGLPYGTYRIEEVYKPKYKLLEITGDRLTNDLSMGMYTFTLSEDSEAIQNRVTINVKNQIDTGFGFGGQDFKDNLSKVLEEEVAQYTVTKANIYVRDEQNNRISDATFKLYDSKGNVLKFENDNGVFMRSNVGSEIITPVNGKIELKALPVGEYKLVNESVNSAFLKCEDRTVEVYSTAVGVTRIELLKNIPRGTLMLSTVYQDAEGEEHFAPKSAYKILNTENEEVLTFVKKLDGTYQRSNAPNAKEEISLKAGKVEVTGIEAGIAYQVGLVDVTDTYGIIKETPEDITVQEGASQEIKVRVKDRSKKFVQINSKCNWALDAEGKIWVNRGSSRGMVCLNDSEGYANIKNKKFSYVCAGIAIDTEGYLWSMEANYSRCLSDTKFVKVEIAEYGFRFSDYWDEYFALDEQAKMWKFRIYWSSSNYRPGELEISRLGGALEDVEITEFSTYGDDFIAIDKNGDVWGYSLNNWQYLPSSYYNNEIVCLTQIPESTIYNIKFKKVSHGDDMSFLIDEDNRLWAMGDNRDNHLGIVNEEKIQNKDWKPICINYENEGNPLNGIKVNEVVCNDDTVAAIDENGRLWTWGYNYEGILGTSFQVRQVVDTPLCITESEENKLYTTKLKQLSIDRISTNYEVGAALDEDGNLWCWGYSSYVPSGYNGRYDYYIPPIKLEISKNAHFDIPKLAQISSNYSSKAKVYAIDEEGKIWYFSDTNEPELFTSNNNTVSKVKIENIKSSIHGYYEDWIAIDSNNNLWGYNYSIIGNANGSSVPINITEYQEFPSSCENILYGKKVKAISISDTSNRYAVIDTEGKLYIISDDSQQCITDEFSELSNVKFEEVSVQYNHCVAVDSDGKVWIWGDEYLTSAQFGTSDRHTDPYCISNEEGNKLNGVRIKHVDTSKYHTLAIDDKGKLYSWGENSYGQLGRVTSSSSTYEIDCVSDIEGTPLYGKKIEKIAISGENYTSYVVDSDGIIWSFGYNNYGELGIGSLATNSTYSSINIYNVNGSLGFIPIDIDVSGNLYYSGGNNCYVLDNNNNIWAWGESYTTVPVKLNKKEQYEFEKQEDLSISDFTTRTIQDKLQIGAKEPEFVDQLESNFTTLCLDGQGGLWTKGTNTYGQLGDGTRVSREYVEKINDKLEGNTIKQLVVTGDTSMVIDTNNHLWVWGRNNYGQCATGTTDSVLLPHCIKTFEVQEILYKGSTMLVKDTEGKLWSWGSNANGICGVNKTDSYILEPTCITENFTVSKMLNTSPRIIEDTEGNLYAWGNNSKGQCGVGEETDTTILKPTPLGNTFKVEQMIIANSNIVVKDTEGKLWSWGDNTYGQCGLGKTDEIIYAPECINKNNEFLAEEILGGGTAVVIKATDGKLWSWGSNSSGQCGLDKTDSVIYTPECINKDNEFIMESKIRIGSTCIIKDTEGNLWSWGSNSQGAAGIGSDSKCIKPKCINENLFECDKLLYSKNNVYIVKAKDGNLWSWGNNTYGQCGITYDADNKFIKTPQQITATGFNSADIVEIKNIQTSEPLFAKASNGEIWVWGLNSKGETGTGLTDAYILPTNLNHNFVEIKQALSGRTPSYSAIDTEGKTWVWGYNVSSMLGVGKTENYIKTPVCVDDFLEDKIYNYDKIVYKYEKYALGSSKTVTFVLYIAQDKNGGLWQWFSDSNSKNIIPRRITSYTGFGYDEDTDKIGLYDDIMYIIRGNNKNVWMWQYKVSTTDITPVSSGFRGTYRGNIKEIAILKKQTDETNIYTTAFVSDRGEYSQRAYQINKNVTYGSGISEDYTKSVTESRLNMVDPNTIPTWHTKFHLVQDTKYTK